MSIDNLNTLQTQFKSFTTDSTDAEKKKARELCNQFEAIFVKQLLQTMRSEDSGLFGDGMGADTYQSMFESQMADDIASTGSIGISDKIFNSLFKDENGSIGTGDLKPLDFSNMIVKRSKPLDSNFTNRIKEYEPIIDSASEKYKLPSELIKAVIKTESYGDSLVVSKAGAKGLMQLMDGTASDLGVRNSFDPQENIFGGTRYLREQLDRFDGNLKLALAAYNAGPGNVEKYNGIPPFKETQNYVVKVLNSAKEMNLDLKDI